jgi:hypothetical protein
VSVAPNLRRESAHVYWRRQLPPLAEQPGDEHVVQARSAPVAYSGVDPDQRWTDGA